MAIFHFHIEDGTFEHEEELVELPTVDAARLHAAALSQMLITQGQGRFARDEAWLMRVTDDAGMTCFSLQFAAVPATAQGRNSYAALAAEAFAR